MNTQKIQAGAQSTKGFTLVELIVVITILVILGTIAFLNLGGMSGSARDSQRVSDLNQINAQITTTQAKSGLVYSTLVTTNAASNPVQTASIAGALAGSAYTAGDLNYAALGIDAAKFKDPTTKTIAYKIGQTSLVGGQWEVSASLEAYNNAAAALVMGTYRSRTQAQTASSGAAVVTAGSTTVTLSTTPFNFKAGDIIAGSAGTGQISSVSLDGKTLTLVASPAPTLAVGAIGNTVQLAADEVKGLTSSGGAANTNAVTNYGIVLPY